MQIDIDIQSGIREVLSPKKKVYPCHVNRISALDDPCLRRLYYMRAAWDKAMPIDDSLAGVFETGNVFEPAIERIVSEVGMASTPPWRIVGTQMATNDNLLREYQISGTIDGFLQVQNGTWKTEGVVDIKTASPNIFPQLTDYAALGRYPWTRKYRGQLMLYSLAHNMERCFILFVNKSNLFDMRLVEFGLDMAYCDTLLEKAKVVNAAIVANAPPPQINDPDECPKCAWFSYCRPDLDSKGNLKFIENEELAGIFDRMAEIESAADEYAELEKARDALLVKGQDIACGQWLIQWKSMTKHFKAQPAKEAFDREEWRKSITKVA